MVYSAESGVTACELCNIFKAMLKEKKSISEFTYTSNHFQRCTIYNVLVFYTCCIHVCQRVKWADNILLSKLTLKWT